MNARQLLTPFFEGEELPEIPVTRLTEQSQLADAGTLFVCIRGAVADGHQYAADAYARGCRLFLAEYDPKLPDDATVLLTDSTRRMLGLLAARFWGEPSRRMRVIGVTGTKGKTTVATLLASLSNRAGIPCGYIGTNGITYADVFRPTKNSTPDAVTLQSTLAEMLECGVHTAVLEVSSQALVQHRVEGMHFDTVLFTNFSPDHIGPTEHRDLEDYLQAKLCLFRNFDAQNAIVFADDPQAERFLSVSHAARKLACTAGSEYLYAIGHVERTLLNGAPGIAFDLFLNGERHAVTLPLLGEVNAQNALLAATVAHAVLGIDAATVAKSLSHVRVAGRSESLSLPNGATVLIDYAHNAVSLQALLSALREYAPARLTVLFGSVGGRTQLRRAELGAIAARLADFVILTSDNPAREDPNAILSAIVEGFGESQTPYRAIPDRREAILYALERTLPGEFLVLAGKGHETYQLIGDCRVPFSERAIVEEFLSKQSTVMQQ